MSDPSPTSDYLVISRGRLDPEAPNEVIGGYWFILAGSLEEAAAIAANNPCRKYGIFYEIRPTDPNCASVFNLSVETPRRTNEPS